MNVHVHQAGQNKFVGQIDDRDISGHICRVDETIFIQIFTESFKIDRSEALGGLD